MKPKFDVQFDVALCVPEDSHYYCFWNPFEEGAIPPSAPMGYVKVSLEDFVISFHLGEAPEPTSKYIWYGAVSGLANQMNIARELGIFIARTWFDQKTKELIKSRVDFRSLELFIYSSDNITLHYDLYCEPSDLISMFSESGYSIDNGREVTFPFGYELDAVNEYLSNAIIVPMCGSPSTYEEREEFILNALKERLKFLRESRSKLVKLCRTCGVRSDATISFVEWFMRGICLHSLNTNSFRELALEMVSFFDSCLDNKALAFMMTYNLFNVSGCEDLFTYSCDSDERFYLPFEER